MCPLLFLEGEALRLARLHSRIHPLVPSSSTHLLTHWPSSQSSQGHWKGLLLLPAQGSSRFWMGFPRRPGVSCVLRSKGEGGRAFWV